MPGMCCSPDEDLGIRQIVPVHDAARLMDTSLSPR